MTTRFKHPSIKYTSRDFNNIRNDLVEYAKRYYPDSYKDFNEASFGAMMVDAVAYVGDILSFYLDYQANESFLTTSNEYNNILKHGKALGYKMHSMNASYGVVTLYLKVPGVSSGFGIDRKYVPILRKGTIFNSMTGTPFTLINDVNFADPGNEATVATEDNGLSRGGPRDYVIKAYGEVVSGITTVKTFNIGNFQRFRRIDLRDPNLTEIISVMDLDGHEYFEVEHLSQNIIYRPIINTGANANLVPNLLRPFVAMRRFVIEREMGRNFLQFGYGSEDNLSNQGLLNSDDIVLQRHGRDHITDTSFDPSRLLQNDKFGVAPANTTLTVQYRTNNAATVNVGAGGITGVKASLFNFTDSSGLNDAKKSNVVGSLEVTNDEPIVGDVGFPTQDEIKRRIFDVYEAQNRGVTTQDYKALIYMIPPKFGNIKRCHIFQDPDAFKRNINIYVISEDYNGNLTKSNSTIKNNLKNWLNQYRMMNDTIDIIDAKIVNVEINFTIVKDVVSDKFTILQAAEARLRDEFLAINEIGDPISISSIYHILNRSTGVADTIDVEIKTKMGAGYMNSDFNVEENMSFDGRYLLAPEDVIFEVKYLDADIKGTVR